MPTFDDTDDIDKRQVWIPPHLRRRVVARKYLKLNGGSKHNKVEAVIPLLERPGGNGVRHVWGYGRVSTVDQDTTCQAQEMVVKQHYAMRYQPQGYAWGGMFCDGAVEAYSPFEERAAARAIISLMHPGDVIMVGKADRFYKSLLDYAKTLESLRSIGVFLYTCDTGLDTSTDMGETIAGITAVLAQQERRRMSTRRKEQVEAMRSAGLMFANANCLGFDKVFAKMLGTRKAYKGVPRLHTQMVMERLWFMYHLMSFPADAIVRLLVSAKFGMETQRVIDKKYTPIYNAKPIPEIVRRHIKGWCAIQETELDVVQYFTPEERVAFFDDHEPHNPFRKAEAFARTLGRTGPKPERICGISLQDYHNQQHERALELRAAKGEESPRRIVESIIASRRRSKL